MKKIGIYTIESVNLGNRLQNYAVQEILSTLGFRPYTIRRRSYTLGSRIRDNIRTIVKRDKHSNYVIFDNNIRWYRGIISQEKVSKGIENCFDFFVIGSDQIWNPTFPFSSAIDYLPFVNREKKISLSASIGIDNVPNEYCNMMKVGLESVSRISVREKSGQNIVMNLTGNDCEVLIDPTLILSSEDWHKVSRKPKGVDFNKKYVLLYFLGEISEERKQYINSISVKYCLEIYNIFDKNDNKIYNSGPGEFLYLIENASLIITDSFHASVFSFIFSKPFVVFDRETNETKMNSRILNLLETFNLEYKYYENITEDNIFECNYSVGKKRLIEEKKRMFDFIRSSLY